MRPLTWFDELNAVLRRALVVGLAVISGLAVVSGLVYVWGVLRRPAPEDGSAWLAASMLLDMGREQTVPAWWSSVLWLLLALAAVLQAFLTRTARALWLLIAGVAAYASVDEYAELHERLDALGDRMLVHLPLDVAYAWVVPGVVIAVVVALVGVRLVRTVTPHVRRGLLLSGLLFLLGAVVLEVISSLLLQHFGVVTWHFALAYHVEEVLEMAAVTLATVSVLSAVRVVRASGGLEVTAAATGPTRQADARDPGPGSSTQP